MSYILKAIRKAEQERQQSRAGNLKDNILHPPQPVADKSRLIIFLLLCNVIGLVLVLGYLYRLNTEKNIPPETAVRSENSVDAARQASANPLPAPAPIQSKSASPKSTPPPQPKKTLSLAQMMLKKPISEKSKHKTHVVPIAPKQIEHPSLSQADKRENKTSSAKTVRQPKVKENSERTPQLLATLDKHPLPESMEDNIHNKSKSPQSRLRSVGDTNAREKTTLKKAQNNTSTQSIPFLEELSRSYQQRVPKLNINVIAYSEDKQDRFIIVDMIRYEEGQEISGGLKLKEIRPDELVLTYSGKTFRMKHP